MLYSLCFTNHFPLNVVNVDKEAVRLCKVFRYTRFVPVVQVEDQIAFFFFFNGICLSVSSASVPLPVVTVNIRQRPLVSPPSLPLSALPHGEPNDVHQEDPGQGIHGHAATLDKKPGPGRHQLAVQHCAAHENAHGHKQQHKERVHGVPEPRGVLPRLFEEPASLQERVGDLAAEQDRAALDAGLAQPQRQHDSQDAHGVVGQHDGALCAEVHAPGHVENEVAQAQHQGADLEGRVLCTCRSNAGWAFDTFTY